MVVASLIFIHTLIGVTCLVQTLHTIKKYYGRVTRFEALITVIMSSIPLGNIGIILYNLSFSDWWNKEI